MGLTFPILSRNRIAICLKGIAKAFRKAYILMSYPSDEVGNHLFDEDLLDEKGVDPWRDVLTEEQYVLCSATSNTRSRAWTMWNITASCSAARAVR